MSSLSVNNLSARFGRPRQHEIAMLTDTANKALDRLEKAVRQEQQFASEASHELRTPVTGLRTQLEEALLYPDDVDPRETIHTALSTTDRLGQIINDLLVLARLRADPAPPETIDLGELVTQEAAARPQGHARGHPRHRQGARPRPPDTVDPSDHQPPGQRATPRELPSGDHGATRGGHGRGGRHR
jgi:Signal transduction histidine kinase